MRVTFLLAHFIFGFLTATPEAVRVSSERAGLHGARSSSQVNDVKVMAWTWNSMKRDLTEEAADVFSSDADIIVTCQTEAIEAVRKYTDDSRWLLVSHGEHTGFSGGHSDAQILSVFIRQPNGGEPYVATRTEESRWSRSGIGLGIARLSSDILMETAEVPGLMAVETKIHQTSSAGKGGLSAHISWEARDGHAAYKTSFLCAHLDSQSDTEREHQLVHIFREMNGLTRVSRTALGLMPCLFWDYHSPECQADIRETLNSRHSTHERALISEWIRTTERGSSPWNTDSLVVLGDLNYRLAYSDLAHVTPFGLNDTGPLARLVSTADGRQEMAVADPLNPRGSHPTALVRPGLAGFGLVCNEPYRQMPWTYKRRGGESCAHFGRALRACDEAAEAARLGLGSLAEACEEAPGLAVECYGKRVTHDGMFGTGEPDEWEWQTKGSDLQLGWLDRVCVRAVGSSNVRIALTGEERGWAENGESDHLAVSSVFVITPP